MKVVDLVSKFIVATRGHPLAVTVPEAQLLHDFATWVDKQAAQHRVQADETYPHEKLEALHNKIRENQKVLRKAFRR